MKKMSKYYLSKLLKINNQTHKKYNNNNKIKNKQFYNTYKNKKNKIKTNITLKKLFFC
jgi:hypothetical protein